MGGGARSVDSSTPDGAHNQPRRNLTVGSPRHRKRAARRTRDRTVLAEVRLGKVGTRLAACEPPGLEHAAPSGCPGMGD